MTFPSFLSQWNHWWFRQTPPHLLAVFRIVFGAFLLFYFGIQFPDVAMRYSSEGLLMPMFTLPIFTPPPVSMAYALFTLFIIVLFSFTIGFCTRVSAAASLLFYAYYHMISLFQFGTSFDRLFMFSLLVLTFSGCGRTFSLDMRLSRGAWTAWEPISILPQRILSLQIAATYLGVGWQKLVLDDWRTGKVLAYGFVGRWATEPAYAIARMNIPLAYYDALNWLIKAFEISIPFGVWHRATRWWTFAGGALFHIGIAVLLAIWWFLPLIPAYILFLDPGPFGRLRAGCSTGVWNGFIGFIKPKNKTSGNDFSRSTCHRPADVVVD